MADTKDSALTSATLPLDGAGIIKLVQGGNDRKTTGEVIGTRSVIMTSTQTINSGAANLLTDITQLVFTMVSGATYHFNCVVYYTVNISTTGSRWTVNTTGGAPTAINYNSQYTLTASTWTYNMANASVQLPAASNATSVASALNTGIIEGTVTASADGTLQVQGAREVTTSSTNIIVAVGSFLQWQRIS